RHQLDDERHVRRRRTAEDQPVPHGIGAVLVGCPVCCGSHLPIQHRPSAYDEAVGRTHGPTHRFSWEPQALGGASRLACASASSPPPSGEAGPEPLLTPASAIAPVESSSDSPPVAPTRSRTRGSSSPRKVKTASRPSPSTSTWII